MNKKEIVVTAKFIGRKTYNIIVSDGSKKEESLFILPFQKDKDHVIGRLEEIKSKLAEKGMEITSEQIWSALKVEAKRTNRGLPKLS